MPEARQEMPEICGKPIYDLPDGPPSGLFAPELADTAGPPRGVFILSVTTLCILPPNHDGDCRDAAVKYDTKPPAYGTRLVSDLIDEERGRLWDKSSES